MARKPKNTPTENATTIDDSMVVVNDNVGETKDKRHTRTHVVEPIEDSDEIKVVSLIDGVSYLDNRTGDMYEWENAGHVEYMTFETLKNMWRNSKTYFKDMWLKPDDERVIEKFGLTRIYEKYEYLMDKSNYTRENINKVIEIISDKSTPNGMKFTACNYIVGLVDKEEISDISVIRTLEKNLNLDLF